MYVYKVEWSGKTTTVITTTVFLVPRVGRTRAVPATRVDTQGRHKRNSSTLMFGEMKLSLALPLVTALENASKLKMRNDKQIKHKKYP